MSDAAINVLKDSVGIQPIGEKKNYDFTLNTTNQVIQRLLGSEYGELLSRYPNARFYGTQIKPSTKNLLSVHKCISFFNNGSLVRARL